MFVRDNYGNFVGVIMVSMIMCFQMVAVNNLQLVILSLVMLLMIISTTTMIIMNTTTTLTTIIMIMLATTTTLKMPSFLFTELFIFIYFCVTVFSDPLYQLFQKHV